MNKKTTVLLGVFTVCFAVVLTVAFCLPEILFANFKATLTDADALDKALPNLAYSLDHTAFAQYQQLEQTDVKDELFAAVKDSKNAAAFSEKFTQIISDAYWQGYDYHISVQTNLGGRRGTLRVNGENIPETAFAILNYGDHTETVTVRNGTGYYNIYGKDAKEITYYLAQDKAGKAALTAVNTVTVNELYLPQIAITELSNEHTTTYYSDIVNSKKQHSGKTEQKFQYIELYNYSDTEVDLKDYTFVYCDDKGEHSFEWITEKNGSLIIRPQEVYVIGVYAADSAIAGYHYDTDSQLSEYWQAFNAFYNTDIPVTNRTLIACVASGKASTLLDGIDHLERSKNEDVTVSAKLIKDGRTLCSVSLPDDMPSNSYAYQFLPGSTEQQELLFVTGCFPGKLLTEQNLEFCESPAPENTNKIKAVSYNILATDDNPGNATVEQRSHLFYRFIEEEQPDTIGLQEVNFRWVATLPENMEALGYAEVQGISGSGHTYTNVSTSNQWDLLNPIYYKTNTFELLDSGHSFLTSDGTMDSDQWDSVNMKRTLTWVVLKDKTDGEVYIHVNTHFVLSGKVARVEQARRMYQTAAELQKKYGGSIIITGDHNMAEGSEPYQTYLNGGVAVDAKYQTTDHNSIGTYTNFDTQYNEKYCVPIDFCFVSPDVTVDSYRVFNGKYPDGTISDHSAVIVELYR
ncbi:MAG: endonuclease/exonuclease/phosphatase family protein [Clostridia bacterium]|nr:endonuclease/exonuclease/phosphatase family protein [Clostridia bacterium]